MSQDKQMIIAKKFLKNALSIVEIHLIVHFDSALDHDLLRETEFVGKQPNCINALLITLSIRNTVKASPHAPLPNPIKR